MFNISAKEYDAYVVKNRYKYLTRFEKFDALSGGFIATWHWPAFFFGFWWFLYRKMYVWAFVAFLVGFLPFGNFIAQIIYGISGYYLYHRDCVVKINSIMSVYKDEASYSALREAGGVNSWVYIVGLICFFLQPIWIFIMTLLFGGTFMFSMTQIMV